MYIKDKRRTKEGILMCYSVLSREENDGRAL